MLIHFAIPIYNEKQLLKKNALKLLNFLNQENYKFDWQIILIINGSSDGSEKIAQNLERKYYKINYFIIKEKGKGNAIKKALEKSMADVFIYMDIDLAVSLKNINNLISEIKKGSDIVIGSRLLKNSKVKRSFFGNLRSKSYIFLSKIVFRHDISDLQCGFKAIKKDAWKKIRPFIKDKKWFFDTELLIFAQIFNLKITEIPVDWSENRYEKRISKVRVIRDSLDFIKKLKTLKKRIKKLK